MIDSNISVRLRHLTLSIIGSLVVGVGLIILPMLIACIVSREISILVPVVLVHSVKHRLGVLVRNGIFSSLHFLVLDEILMQIGLTTLPPLSSLIVIRIVPDIGSLVDLLLAYANHSMSMDGVLSSVRVVVPNKNNVVLIYSSVI